MKTFETPVVEINMFAVEDIITTSGETVNPCPRDVTLPCIDDF